jgi:DNA repair protein RecO (recombination protein O)
MALVSTEAFVLRTYNLAENDKIAVLFTKDLGKIRLVAKGARKMRSRFGASLEVFAHIRALFHHHENRELFVLDKAEIIYSPFAKQSRLRTNYYLFYFAELVHEFYPDHEKNTGAFKLLLNIEKSIQADHNLEFLARYVELQLLLSQGILSSVAFCSQCSRTFGSLLERRYLGPATEVLCKRCRSRDSVPLAGQVVRSIDSFEKHSPDWVATLSDRTLQELGSFSHLLIARFLGKELQSYLFKKQLIAD